MQNRKWDTDVQNRLLFCFWSCFPSYLIGGYGQRFVIFFFFLPFQSTRSWLYWFFLFHNLYFICFLSELYYILPSAAFKFCLFCCFSNSSRLMLDCLTEISYFLKKTCITMNFLLRTGFPASHRLYIIVFSLSFASRYF